MSPRIHLRPLATSDATEMVSVLSDPSLYEFTGGRPPTLDKLARQYAFQSRGGPADNSEVWLNLLIVLKDTDEAIGYVQATIPTQEHSAEIAWVVGAPWQGVGHAKEAAALLVAELSQRGGETDHGKHPPQA